MNDANRTIRPLEIVTLPDGDVGTVCWASRTEVHVVHEDRDLGRGPWIFSASQVALADDGTADGYVKRCDRHDQRRAA